MPAAAATSDPRRHRDWRWRSCAAVATPSTRRSPPRWSSTSSSRSQPASAAMRSSSSSSQVDHRWRSTAPVRCRSALTTAALAADGLDAVPVRGGRTATVPGALGLLEEAVNRFGTRSLAELAQPAITLADEGFDVRPTLAAAAARAAAEIGSDPVLGPLYVPGGEPVGTGQRVRNPALAELHAHGGGDGSVRALRRSRSARTWSAPSPPTAATCRSTTWRGTAPRRCRSSPCRSPGTSSGSSTSRRRV